MVRELIKEFPVKSMPVRMELAGEDYCPDCGDNLDTVKICRNSDCRADHFRMVPSRHLRYLRKTPDAEDN